MFMRKLHPLFLVSLMMLTACVPPRVDNRGHVGIERKLTQITPGTSTEQDVMNVLGSPSTRSSFGEAAWYYVSAKKESVAFFKPEISDQKVTQIKFNESGIVTAVDHYSLKDRKDIQIAQEITPTEGQTLGLWEQILGNFGRFNNTQGYTGPRSSTNRAPGRQ